MPLAVALLLLGGLSGGWGCLQCDLSVQETLRQLRLRLLPSRFGREHLRARAQALLLGMEGPFFRDYAANVFAGEIETHHLDLVAIFAKNQINRLRVDSLRDGPLLEELVTLRRKVTKKLKSVLRSYELKDMLKEEVLDCVHCLKTSPTCIKKNNCFEFREWMNGGPGGGKEAQVAERAAGAIQVKAGWQRRCGLSVDRQPRTALRYDRASGHPRTQARLAIIVSVCLAVIVFGVIVAS
ncbi:Izumo sperm-egg fusion protein 2 [Myotis davidii]|uniref:Izumo sperm-egg fusion protein 2 n=1 Tax=Myotis davidii TaxID=225400 RepID=L5LXH5_MYODS|nr:Izumo sperm-egg fusion protein 2 [Myotis davidii]